MHKQTVVKMVSACFVTLCLAVGITTSQPQHSKASTQTTQFISKLGPSVKSVANSYKLYPSVMMAQAALESGWGSSTLSTSANNYFGVKGAYNGQSVTMSTAEYDSNGQLYYTDAQFKKYPSIKASMTDNAQLLRNGISGTPSFYSGTWRENASTYEDAANALTGKYATAPNYGQSLINLIQTYSLDALDSGGSTGGSSANADKITYNSASSNQTATLSSAFRKYAVYNHVTGSGYKTTKYAWKTLGGWAGRPVWLDNRAYKSRSKTNWYRIRFSKQTTAKKYWVYAKVLSFPSTKYSTTKATGTLSTTKNYVYNHVYNSSYLAKVLTTTDQLGASKVAISQKATHVQNGLTSIWYKVTADQTTGWVEAPAFSKIK